ncbi:hypothetical protein KCV87_14835 [Actinosynnema pretiosum subsp. pretiosum]|uniref:HEAT repeat domain-containing protein n=2 Tax=Actinosynnema TaxID=40566 RepID=C6WQ45_ACTMD|nr:hypothetical protein [Actinosynnema mirum]ACU35101.1 hypothetical protein Amir_1146 [Actinosynnema mirum DSM 43827]AXX28457.1 hypothetical protein APASM_1092 [Actinosynnema pretiosum subsp. pretiosum]QUF07196.1 hypothetical protein KCV87_14835 [Actinosynnema pretiosum subsp. pretiosum]
MPTARELLFRDADGEPLTFPDEVLYSGDPRYLARVADLRALLTDESAEGYHRFLAVLALTAWGHGPVYPVVAAIARAGRGSPWYGEFRAGTDGDYSFPELAGAVAEGRGRTDDEPGRLTALRELLARADEVRFHWQLAHAADEPELADALADAVRRCLDRADEPDFDRLLQAADLCAVLGRHDRPRAEALARELLARDPRTTIRTHLCSVVPFTPEARPGSADA